LSPGQIAHGTTLRVESFWSLGARNQGFGRRVYPRDRLVPMLGCGPVAGSRPTGIGSGFGRSDLRVSAKPVRRYDSVTHGWTSVGRYPREPITCGLLCPWEAFSSDGTLRLGAGASATERSVIHGNSPRCVWASVLVRTRTARLRGPWAYPPRNGCLDESSGRPQPEVAPRQASLSAAIRGSFGVPRLG
jgi:hypothetical protein